MRAHPTGGMVGAVVSEIDPDRLAGLLEEETSHFVAAHPLSAAAHRDAVSSMIGGVPMNWMNRWPGPFPVYVSQARGAGFTCVDGHSYVDFCLGDTGAMTGHSPDATVEAVVAQLGRGITTMLPTEDSTWVARELQRRFGLPYWSFTLTATDANRFALRIARQVTGRPRILVFDWCYHGTVDETFVTRRPDGSVGHRPGAIGPAIDPAATTRIVEFNDPDALAAALGAGDVAAVLAEPAMTNMGIVLPDPGFHETLRDETRRTGTLLILDETHTFCAGPGGMTARDGLEPDMFVVGKPLAGGIPAAAYGMSEAVAAAVREAVSGPECDVSGIGGTLAGNALSLAAMRATLEHVLTAEAFDRMIPLAERWARGVEDVIERHGLPWYVKRLGARAEYWFRPAPARNGAEAHEAVDEDLDRYLHLAALNRGILMTPFHNMALMSPQTTEADIDCHTEVFGEVVATLVG